MAQTSEFYIKNLWRWKCGMPEIKENIVKDSYNEIYEYVSREMSKFFKLMTPRIVMGTFRYGGIDTNAEYDYLKYLKIKLERYEKTGNTEMLVDVANLAWLEFRNGKHPNKHFEAVDGGDHNVMIKGDMK